MEVQWGKVGGMNKRVDKKVGNNDGEARDLKVGGDGGWELGDVGG